jgi:hypothetical protein
MEYEHMLVLRTDYKSSAIHPCILDTSSQGNHGKPREIADEDMAQDIPRQYIPCYLAMASAGLVQFNPEPVSMAQLRWLLKEHETPAAVNDLAKIKGDIKAVLDREEPDGIVSTLGLVAADRPGVGDQCWHKPWLYNRNFAFRSFLYGGEGH